MDAKQHSSDFSVVRDYIRNSWPTQPVHGFPAADANDALHRIEEQLEASHSALRWIALEAGSGMRDGVLRSAALLRIRDSAYSVVGAPNPASCSDPRPDPGTHPEYWTE